MSRARAFDRLVDGDVDGALEDLARHLEAAPGDAGAWLAMGTARASRGALEEALAALARAVALDGRDVEARLARGRVLLRLGRLEDAAAALVEAATLAPDDGRVLATLGVVLYDQRRHDEAIAALSRAVAACPDDARACFALGLAFEGKRDVGAALAAHREAVRRDPLFVDARLALADTLASMGEHEAALAELDVITSSSAPPSVLDRAAENRVVLRRALAAMADARLLGKSARALEASALVVEGGLRKRRPGRFTGPLVELHATTRDDGSITSLFLALTDADRAARAEDDVFKVTVVNRAGERAPASFATAITLTFLREALGCPMTRASELYAELLGGRASVEHAGASVRFDSVARPERTGERLNGLRCVVFAGDPS